MFLNAILLLLCFFQASSTFSIFDLDFYFYLDFFFLFFLDFLPLFIWTFISLTYLDYFFNFFSLIFFFSLSPFYILVYSIAVNHFGFLSIFFSLFLIVSLSECVRGFGFVLDFIHVSRLCFSFFLMKFTLSHDAIFFNFKFYIVLTFYELRIFLLCVGNNSFILQYFSKVLT